MILLREFHTAHPQFREQKERSYFSDSSVARGGRRRPSLTLLTSRPFQPKTGQRTDMRKKKLFVLLLQNCGIFHFRSQRKHKKEKKILRHFTLNQLKVHQKTIYPQQNTKPMLQTIIKPDKNIFKNKQRRRLNNNNNNK